MPTAQGEKDAIKQVLLANKAGATALASRPLCKRRLNLASARSLSLGLRWLASPLGRLLVLLLCLSSGFLPTQTAGRPALQAVQSRWRRLRLAPAPRPSATQSSGLRR